jgi:hypothetical protein
MMKMAILKNPELEYIDKLNKMRYVFKDKAQRIIIVSPCDMRKKALKKNEH